MKRAKVKASRLSLSYVNKDTGAQHAAVNSVSFDVYEGEFLCIVGPSGCGKSTILAAIAGFISPTSGALTVDGRPIDGPGPDRGVVFQEYALLPWMRVLGNVALGLRYKGTKRREREEIARKFLRLTDMAHAERKFPHELSGGMRQRVAVARTMANSPEIMLMDEPFAAVDAQNRMRLQEEIVRIWQTTGVTIVFVTHSVEEAVFLGDRVLVLTPGPGEIRSVVPVDIPRERRATWKHASAEPALEKLKKEILRMVFKEQPVDA